MVCSNQYRLGVDNKNRHKKTTAKYQFFQVFFDYDTYFEKMRLGKKQKNKKILDIKIKLLYHSLKSKIQE